MPLLVILETGAIQNAAISGCFLVGHSNSGANINLKENVASTISPMIIKMTHEKTLDLQRALSWHCPTIQSLMALLPVHASCLYFVISIMADGDNRSVLAGLSGCGPERCEDCFDAPVRLLPGRR